VRCLRRILFLWLILALCAPPAWSADAAGQGSDPTPDPEEETKVDDPVFPGHRQKSPFRLELGARFVPDQDLGPGHTSLYRPEAAARVAMPLSDRAAALVRAQFGVNHYTFRGGAPLVYNGRPLLDEPLTLYRSRLGVQGAYRLNHEAGFWLREGEIWSLLGGVSGSANFESGTFDDSLSGTVAMAIGYEIENKLRLGLGVSLSTSIDDGGVKVGPLATLRWNINERLILRDRGLGLQLEYHPHPDLELYAAGFRDSDQFTLQTTQGLDDLTLRDRQWLVGGGFEWRTSRRLLVDLEAGAVVWRRLRVHSDDFGTLDSQRGDPTPYLEIRFELRP
jgi:hypothetical protein